MEKGKPMIMIGIGSRPSGEPLGKEYEEAEESDKEMMTAMAPKGNFTSRGLAPLVKATNKILPLFGQTPDYPMVEDTKELPEDFTRILAMVAGAVEEAIAAEVLEPEMAILLDTIRDDSSLMAVAGKLEMLSKSKDFKKFLAEPVKEEESMGQTEGMEMGEESGLSPEEEDNLMMGRMS